MRCVTLRSSLREKIGAISDIKKTLTTPLWFGSCQAPLVTAKVTHKGYNILRFEGREGVLYASIHALPFYTRAALRGLRGLHRQRGRDRLFKLIQWRLALRDICSMLMPGLICVVGTRQSCEKSNLLVERHFFLTLAGFKELQEQSD